MSIETSIQNMFESFGAGSTGESIALFIVNFAEDISLAFELFMFMSACIGFGLFVWALLDVKNMKKANGGGQITGGGTMMKIIFSALLGVFYNVMEAASISIYGAGNPMQPASYVEAARAIQSVSPFMAMLFAIMSIVTVVGWYHGLKSLYLFATVNGKQDKQAHISQAMHMFFGSVIMVNLGLTAAGFFLSGGVEIEQFGDL